MKKINVYLNEIPLYLFEWMEIRHMLYYNTIPELYRNLILEGKAVVTDNEGYVMELEDKIKENEHYHVIYLDQADWITEGEEDKQFIQNEIENIQNKLDKDYNLKQMLSSVFNNSTKTKSKKKREIKNFV